MVKSCYATLQEEILWTDGEKKTILEASGLEDIWKKSKITSEEELLAALKNNSARGFRINSDGHLLKTYSGLQEQVESTSKDKSQRVDSPIVKQLVGRRITDHIGPHPVTPHLTSWQIVAFYTAILFTPMPRANKDLTVFDANTSSNTQDVNPRLPDGSFRFETEVEAVREGRCTFVDTISGKNAVVISAVTFNRMADENARSRRPSGVPLLKSQLKEYTKQAVLEDDIPKIGETSYSEHDDIDTSISDLAIKKIAFLARGAVEEVVVWEAKDSKEYLNVNSPKLLDIVGTFDPTIIEEDTAPEIEGPAQQETEG